MPVDPPATDDASWTLRDYVSPGLVGVRPDDAFPHRRAGDALHHPWKYLRRDVPHVWSVDERFPLMGFLNRDEATLLHNIALRFAGSRALEIGSWLGWSTCHLALAGVHVDSIDPVHDDPGKRASIEASLAACGVADRVRLLGGRSPDAIAQAGGRWRLFFVDGDHEGGAPMRDTAACLPFADDDCAFVFHDVAAPPVGAAVRLLADRGFHVVLFQTAQIMAMAWRGDVTPPPHVPDPEVSWQVPAHLLGLPICGVDPLPARGARQVLGEVLAAAEPTARPAGGTGAARPSVCIVTSELVGPFKNGGIGTAMTGLAETLASDGVPVTVLYTGGIWSPDVDLSGWREHYAALGIALEALDISAFGTIAGPLKDRGFGVPWFVLRYLGDHPFDVVHFNDCCGEGSLCLVAKRLGIAFQESLLVVALHSPSRWVLDLNHAPPDSLTVAAFNHAEHLSLACTDVLWSPSHYLLEWAAAHDFALPPRTVVQQYAIPSARVGRTPPAEPARSTTAGSQPEPTREIVFFGRLEERKGLRRFCAAIHLLRDEIAAAGVAVAFLGKPDRCGGLPSLEYIARRSAAWTFPVHTVTDLGQPEALQRLARPGTVAVMASPVDNSPCTVYEALDRGIPFLAARTGGIPELVAPADRAHVLFDPTVAGLRAALASVIAGGARTARPAVPQAETRRTWLAFHDRWREFLPAPAEPAPPVSTVAVIIDHQPGDRLDLTLGAFPQCPAITRVVIVNHGGDALPLDSLDLTVADPAVLGEALADVVEDAVLLIHSGAALEPAAFGAMLDALGRTTADGLQPAGRVDGPKPLAIPPLGVSATAGLFDGATYTGALLVRREALRTAAAGQAWIADSPFLGLADFCAARGLRIWPYPREVVTLLPQHAPAAGAATAARLAAYAGAGPHDRYYMLGVGHAAVTKPAPIVTRMQLATAATGLGLSWAVRAGSWGLRRLRRWRG